MSYLVTTPEDMFSCDEAVINIVFMSCKDLYNNSFGPRQAILCLRAFRHDKF